MNKKTLLSSFIIALVVVVTFLLFKAQSKNDDHNVTTQQTSINIKNKKPTSAIDRKDQQNLASKQKENAIEIDKTQEKSTEKLHINRNLHLNLLLKFYRNQIQRKKKKKT